MKTLELFSGSKSFSNAVAKLGHEIYTSDYVSEYNPDYCVDIMDFDIEKLPYKPEVIWASPPCTAFSVASIGKHWNVDNTPKTEEAEYGLMIVRKTIEIINSLNPKLWYIENPRGKLRKLIDPELAVLTKFVRRHTVTYCRYGDTRMKPTDIWTNDLMWMPREVCKNGDSCHTSAPRGSRTGTQGLQNPYERSRIPEQLFIDIEKSWKYY